MGTPAVHTPPPCGPAHHVRDIGHVRLCSCAAAHLLGLNARAVCGSRPSRCAYPIRAPPLRLAPLNSLLQGGNPASVTKIVALTVCCYRHGGGRAELGTRAKRHKFMWTVRPAHQSPRAGGTHKDPKPTVQARHFNGCFGRRQAAHESKGRTGERIEARCSSLALIVFTGTPFTLMEEHFDTQKHILHTYLPTEDAHMYHMEGLAPGFAARGARTDVLHLTRRTGRQVRPYTTLGMNVHDASSEHAKLASAHERYGNACVCRRSRGGNFQLARKRLPLLKCA